MAWFKLYEKKWGALKAGSHHLAVGMHSYGEKALLLDSDMWRPVNQYSTQVSSCLFYTGMNQSTLYNKSLKLAKCYYCLMQASFGG